MTSFAKNRDMPTLSLQGSVCVPLFLFILVLSQLTVSSVFAQDLQNRTEEMYPFGTVIIASEPLPDKVYEAQKNKILVSVIFTEKGTKNVIMNSVGTGFVGKDPGNIITARHLFYEALVAVKKIKNENIKSNSKFDYNYIFTGTIITDSAWIRFPLFLESIGEEGTFKDIMILRPDTHTMEKASVVGDPVHPNPYSVLLKTFEFADAKVGDKVYISGFAPVVAEYFDKNYQPIPVYLDLINHTFSAEVEALLPDISENKTGIKIIYRLRDSAEPGFSGGKVMNDQGQVIGMTIAMSLSKNFVYVFSSKDIGDFIKNNKLK